MTTLRSATTAADREVVERLAQLEQHDLSVFTCALPGPDGRFDVPRLPRFFSDVDHRAFVVDDRGGPVGFCLVRPFEGGASFVHSFFVVRAVRRRGVGSAAAAELLRTHGQKWVIAFVDEHAVAARFWGQVATDVAGDAWASEQRTHGGTGFTFITLRSG